MRSDKGKTEPRLGTRELGWACGWSAGWEVAVFLFQFAARCLSLGVCFQDRWSSQSFGSLMRRCAGGTRWFVRFPSLLLTDGSENQARNIFAASSFLFGKISSPAVFWSGCENEMLGRETWEKREVLVEGLHV